jgi:pyruvate/2-oxoglutarate dehydrogenase complex dihydrolipoamide acyltransferase (E2) component
MDDCAIGEWMKGEGEEVEAGEVILIVETDKASNDVAAPVSGRLRKIHTLEGARVSPGDLLAEIETD